LLAIILIDLVLAGDNAIVIALAARSLPPGNCRRKAIVWGTLGAIAVRSAMTVGVVWLLQVPGLMLAGGLGLLWIAYKLLADNGRRTSMHRAGRAHLLGGDEDDRRGRCLDGG
jgi:predicted tellurium resistance membrane protein TerC